MHVFSPLHGLKRSSHICPRRVNASNSKNSDHSPYMKMECDCLYGWIKDRHIHKNLTQNGEPRIKVGTQKKKKLQLLPLFRH